MVCLVSGDPRILGGIQSTQMSEPDTTPLHQFEQKRTLLRAKMERLEFPEDEIRWLLAHVRPDSADELLDLLTKWEGEMSR